MRAISPDAGRPATTKTIIAAPSGDAPRLTAIAVPAVVAERRRARILLAEDNELNQLVASELLGARRLSLRDCR